MSPFFCLSLQIACSTQLAYQTGITLFIWYFKSLFLRQSFQPYAFLCATSYLLSVTNQQGNSYWLLLIDSLKEYIFIIFSLVKFSNYLSLSTISGNKRVILFSIFYFLTSGLITSQSTFSDIINNIPLSYLQQQFGHKVCKQFLVPQSVMN